MYWVFTILGVSLVTVALRDIFHTLWHPGGFGPLSHAAFVLTWRATRVLSRRPRGSELGGPLGLLLTLAVWTVMLVAGFALIYLPRMPDGFNYASSLDVPTSSGPLGAVYVSVVALTTLGLGDIQPASSTLRLLLPIEALLGFLLLTAGISWILQLYPALVRRRALARHLTTMRRCGTAEQVGSGDAAAVHHLEGLRSELAMVHVDLVQYEESYYFREASPDLALAAALPYVDTLASAGQRSSSPAVQHSARLLAGELSALLQRLRRHHLRRSEDEASTLAAFARDHGYEGQT
ncbi:potassium channel family protein [Nocardioidaceae bacterium]|nr:potassium channel family protein [Nocardioidaceae bacterium]